ncbi:MAG: alcohol dehydrogenase [Spirochaetaceae bacterium]|nr:MAG: alcohol dehydrogenase [Spirochaetaceae bacterium]
MKQAVMTAPGAIEYRQVDVPDVAAHEVLIRVRKIGVCGSDIHVFHGLHPYTSYPVVQGHEVSGEVERVGAGVSAFAAGDRVTFVPQVVCGQCYPCRHGMHHICDSLKVMGFQTGGAAQEYFAVPESLAVKLPGDMSFNQGALIEPMAVAVHALARAGDVADGRVLVLGAGPIGNLVAQAARGLGAAAVMITDISDVRLAKARDCGIEAAVNVAHNDLADAVVRHFGADKADIILECVGVESAIAGGIAVARKGSVLVVVGVYGHKPTVDLGLVQDRELTLRGSLMYQHADYRTAIDLVVNGKVVLEPLVTDTFPFERYLDAYHHIEKSADQTLKVMIEL